VRLAALLLLASLPVYAQAVELRAGTVTTADGRTLAVEEGGAYLPKTTLLAAGKRLADCEAARASLEAPESPSASLAVVVAVGLVLAAGGGYVAGRLAK
jgi:hypothetical protein